MIWLIEANHDDSCCINDYDRDRHHIMMKQRSQESLESRENADTTFNVVGCM